MQINQHSADFILVDRISCACMNDVVRDGRSSQNDKEGKIYAMYCNPKVKAVPQKTINTTASQTSNDVEIKS